MRVWLVCLRGHVRECSDEFWPAGWRPRCKDCGGHTMPTEPPLQLFEKESQ